MTKDPGNLLLLRYSHNIVEHLGLKLYQNQPTRVIAEIISNCWDADATRVAVNLKMSPPDERFVAVLDDGCGMDRDRLRTSYLVIGHPKRATATETSKEGRPLMGRKGIGKLAAFGIAKFVDVVTTTESDDGKTSSYWLRFDLTAVLAVGATDEPVTYEPKLLCDGVPLHEIPVAEDSTGQVNAWIDLVKDRKRGTLVLMSGLTLGRAINQDQLIESLGTRFSSKTAGHMRIDVNGVQVTLENSLPAFEFRIPKSGENVEQVGGREVRSWAGFVKNAEWPQDQAGVGVYAHGKLAQDRPFTFGIKGKEIYSRYMLGFVEADWLDELKVDLISTDRTSVNWADDEVAALYQWGQEKTKEWIRDFERWRADEAVNENKKLVSEIVNKGGAPRVTDEEQDEIVRMVSAITPSFGKDGEAKERLVKAVSEAWVQKPMRRLVRDLWDSFGHAEDAPPAAFTTVIERLSSYSVPESLNLAVIFAQRAFALTRLHDYVHHGREVDLQKLIERFPWIIEPDLAVLTANESLKTGVAKAEALGHLIQGRRVVAGIPDKNKPDFVFLASPESKQIVIVELKNPQEDLTVDNRIQLQDYMEWVAINYVGSKITGYLIGRKPEHMSSPYTGLNIVHWNDVLQRSRARNLELLSAMLLRTGSSASTDARAIDAVELGGAEARAMLERLAQEHTEIKELMDSFELIPVAAAAAPGPDGSQSTN